jgi:hypothetical protein
MGGGGASRAGTYHDGIIGGIHLGRRLPRQLRYTRQVAACAMIVACR